MLHFYEGKSATYRQFRHFLRRSFSIIETSKSVWGNVLGYCRGDFFVTPTIYKLIFRPYKTPHLAAKCTRLLFNGLLKVTNGGILQNCRGWGYRPDKNPILLQKHLK